MLVLVATRFLSVMRGTCVVVLSSGSVLLLKPVVFLLKGLCALEHIALLEEQVI